MSRVRLLRAIACLVGTVLLAGGAALPSSASTQRGESEPAAAERAQGQAQQHTAQKKAQKKAQKNKHHKHKKKKCKKRKKCKRKVKAVTPKAPTPAAPTAAPTNAAKIFKWGNAQINDEFHGAMAPTWSVNSAGAGLVRNQNGMLTLNTTATSGTVTASWTAGARQYGRWEARVRTRQYGAMDTPYRAVWELVPTTGDQCSRSIILSDSTIGKNPATLHVRNTGADFSATKVLDLRQDVFHTYAVEVTPDHISWFIDTRVVMTETRSAARTGASYAVRFRMVAPPGVRMNRGRMQMDWVRYYTLERKNAKSISAPPATLGSYDGLC